MKPRTLVSDRRYFGVHALDLREAAARVLHRAVGKPIEQAHVSGRQLRQDFRVNTVEGEALAHRLIEGGLLQPHPERPNDFAPTPRLAEFAAARVVGPLPRAKARRLVARACDLAEKINADWSRNPISIVSIAAFGQYLTERGELADLRLGLIVCRRPRERLSRWLRVQDDRVGAAEIRQAFESMSSYVRVTITETAGTLPRPFSIAWRDESLG